ncbi:DNA-binding response regulator, OmpR family, contains REC and winged-helix (wHTH) domain [Filimonas lacunae]|uniref:DNA-binding response regulator, OmpR family, contains REC and winged-helix (WHTH) domain n=1 Tax=Filimonas lacunae TaxID=477680 RepID=A0A173MCV2_9BACT|nr:response regulator transcription factor [Filimonas lacunae]BAV05350.1 two-component system response regulator [Filimonas lacunae]SIT21827.1 DNA-binding response regulator, OmpR family, contains REC and winged-helix (wHTH) domain [Filimonas lacunae]
MKLLLVEDEPALLDELETYLGEQGHLCERAATFHEAEDKILLYHYDMVILDITLPGGSGLSILKLLKDKDLQAGVLILSAKDSLTDKLAGLELGADDYLTKPFYMEELNARINAFQRRTSFSGSNIITADALQIDTQAKEVTCNGRKINLTKKEYELLLYFLVNRKRVVSKESIAAHLWGDNYDMTGSYDIIYTHTMNLRKKISKFTGEDYIETVYGMGYKWIDR